MPPLNEETPLGAAGKSGAEEGRRPGGAQTGTCGRLSIPVRITADRFVLFMTESGCSVRELCLARRAKGRSVRTPAAPHLTSSWWPRCHSASRINAPSGTFSTCTVATPGSTARNRLSVTHSTYTVPLGPSMK